MKKWNRHLYLCILVAALLLSGCSVSKEGANTNGLEKMSRMTEGTMEVHFLDVGQGDCTLIESQGHYMLIDAGNNDKGTLVQSYLESQGVEKLDYLIGTHPDSDHIGGMDVILTKFDVDTVIMPDVVNDTRTYDDVVQAMKYKNIQNTLPVVGEQYTLGDAVFTIIAPNNYDYGDNTNDYSVGLLLQNGNNRFLFTGDAEEQAEKDILGNGIDISADVYKAAHHGSATAVYEPFLKAVHPSYSVISCGAGNSYGHPHAETLNWMRANGVQVFRTDEQGTIVAVSDGTKITWNMSPDNSWMTGEQTKSDQESLKSEEKTNKAGTAVENGNSMTEYVLNNSTKKFHRPDCSSVETISEKNKEVTEKSREELILEGYSPCARCEP